MLNNCKNIFPNSFNITFGNTKCVFHESGAIYFPESLSLIVSDLHLEKSFSINFKNNNRTPLPPYDTKDTLEKLGNVLSVFKPKQVVCLGDSFHDKISLSKISIKNKELILQIFKGLNCIWITGNHDPILPNWLKGEVIEEYKIKGINLRHITNSEDKEISGHFHPKVKIKTKNKTIIGKCFIFSQNRILMPAFGTFTGGMFINEILKINNKFKDFQIGFCHNNKIYRYPQKAMSKNILNPISK